MEVSGRLQNGGRQTHIVRSQHNTHTHTAHAVLKVESTRDLHCCIFKARPFLVLVHVYTIHTRMYVQYK